VVGLAPGRLYRIRVVAHNSSGKGEYSNELRVSTSPVTPAAPIALTVALASGGQQQMVTWTAAPFTGGAAISSFV